MKSIIFTIVAGLCLAGTSVADTIYVAQDGSGDFTVIQDAINAASDGDEIIVGAGTYTSSSGEVVDMAGKALSLTSSDGREVTIIDGQDQRVGIRFNSGGSGGEATVTGFTITQSNPGIVISSSPTDITFSDCSITNNNGGEGGGIHCWGGILSLLDCTIASNTSSYNGGGVFAYSGTTLYMNNCELLSNVANDSFGGGGAIMFGHPTMCTLVDCLIEGNTAANEGGGGIWAGSNMILEGCLIRNNTASSAGGGIEMVGDHDVSLMSTAVCGNTPDQIKFHEGSTGWMDLGGNSVTDTCHEPIVITVNHDGTGDYTSIQAAIDAALHGDTVEVSAGTYYENSVNTNGKTIVVSGAVGSDGAPATTVDAEGAYANVFMIDSAETRATVIRNFIIRDGASGNGSGMFINGSSPTISNCIFEDNNAVQHDGGAIVCQNSSPLIIDCTIRNNWTNRHGGGAWCSGTGSPQFVNCDIHGNVASNNAGGIYCAGGDLSMVNCVVSNNNATEEGGGINVQGGSADFSSCRFEGNGAGTAGGGLTLFAVNATMTDCEVISNVATDGGGIYGHESGVNLQGCEIQTNVGGGILSWVSTEFYLVDTSVCGNDEYQISGSWSDQGGNEILDMCNIDSDGDGTWDADDNCYLYNPDQLDCNDNGIGDVCDLADGTSQDCNGNSIPDECESLADCDADGEPDVCEILGGAIDANPADGIPDECQGLALGACCIGGECVPTTLLGCASGQGTYYGDGVTCEDAGCPEVCPGDIDGDGQVGIVDILVVIDRWGICP